MPSYSNTKHTYLIFNIHIFFQIVSQVGGPLLNLYSSLFFWNIISPHTVKATEGINCSALAFRCLPFFGISAV